MPSSNRIPGATSQQTPSPTDRKRKRLARNIHSDERLGQQTIQTLFSGQHKPHTPHGRQSSDPKRSRLDEPSPPTATATATTRTIDDMYTFASRSPAPSDGVVDLTGSPSPSQAKRFGTSIRSGLKPGINPNTGAKKLVVKNLKTNTNWDSKTYFEKVWAQLDSALNLIFQDDIRNVSKEDLYRGTENVCRQGGASTLFSRLENRCKLHLQDTVRVSLERALGSDDIAALREVLHEWKRWSQQMVTIRAIFYFMDRSYLLSSSKPTLEELTRQLFRQYIFDDERLKLKIVNGACDLVAADRLQSQSLDKSLFRDTMEMLHAISVYTASFEPRFLARSQEYVVEWSGKAIQEKSIPEYVSAADALILSEISRCKDFELDSSTQRELLTLLEDHLVLSKATELTAPAALATLLDSNSVTDLTSLYSLLKRRQLGARLRPAFEQWVDKTGTEIVLGKQSEDMIIHLLSLKRRLDFIWATAFQRDESLGHALRETFETFMNKTKKGESTWGTDNTKVGEMIAKYVDQLLREGAKAIPDALVGRRPSTMAAGAEAAADDNDDDEVDEDAEVNQQLDHVLDLFRFVHGKAVFEAFYKKDLARRLLMGRSASADAERSMLARLNTECGSGFTHNLEQMFKDVELSREEVQSYRDRLEDRAGHEKGKGVDLNVNILSAAAWPTYPDVPVVIPADVKRAIDGFELHYKSKHTGRKLDWKHALAHCQMRATFGKGTKELVVSSFQAIILLLFNGLGDGEQLTYSHILTETGLPEAEVKRTLQSLACARLRPLTKHPKGKEINPTDTFSVDLTFTHPKYRVKINQVQLKETKEENKETHMRVAEDRNFECQAAVVRILKSRKTIAHSELVAEVIKATMSRGVLGVADIKKNIDRLIEKDYMEREDGNMYSYIA